MSFRRTSPVFGRCGALIRWLVVGVSGLALVDAGNCYHRSYILVLSAGTFRYKLAERILCLLRRTEFAALVGRMPAVQLQPGPPSHIVSPRGSTCVVGVALMTG